MVNSKQALLQAEATMQISMQLQCWHWYSYDQALAAARFSRKCGELEANPTDPSDDEKRTGLQWTEIEQAEHRSYTTASILASVAFLEASLNELFASASHDNLAVGGGQGGLSENERETLSDLSDMLDRNELLHKFQLVLRMLGKPPFDRGAQPYQDAQLLVRLRNALVHYRPDWHVAGGDADQLAGEPKMVKGLAGRKFSPNPFTGQGSPFFPDKCLGHGCTSWAGTTALAFADDFSPSSGCPLCTTHFGAD